MADPKKFSEFRNHDGTYDGVGILAKLSGTTRAEVRERYEAIKAQHARTAACPLHELLPTGEAYPKAQWRCGSCGWEPDAGHLLAYEQGLQHGREHEKGGGRG